MIKYQQVLRNMLFDFDKRFVITKMLLRQMNVGANNDS